MSIEDEDEFRIEQRQNGQRKLAWVAMATMIAFTIFLFVPFIPESRLEILADIASLFYITQGGVISAYMGCEAFVNSRQRNINGARRSSNSNNVTVP